MKPAGRLTAAVEILTEITERHRTATTALSDWGKSHRFAGSGDRSVIGNLVYDVLRQRLSLAARMGDDSSRSLVIAAAPDSFAVSGNEIAAMCDGSQHALAPITDAERAGLSRHVPEDAPEHVRADLPEWVVPSLRAALGDSLVAEGRAMARRAPLDLRVNRLKADRGKVLAALSSARPDPTPLSPVGIRIAAPPGTKRLPNVEAEASHGKGWFEVQDEGSQIAALLACAGPRQQVLDLCAGAGGKTLALGAEMSNTGQLYAYDRDKLQLRPIFDRIRRASLRNVQVMDAGDEAALDALVGRFDLVFVDAPCTGSGTWRRRPDSKWRLKPDALQKRLAEQHAVLERAAGLVRPGGRVAYVTCSLMPEENTAQVAAFLDRHPDFALTPYTSAWTQSSLGGEPPSSADGRTDTLLLTPSQHGTDGFFIALLERSSPGTG